MRNHKKNKGSQQSSQQEPDAGNRFEAQLDRIKSLFGIRAGHGADTELANKLGLTQPAIGGWRANGVIPAKWITKICESEGILMEWLLLGTGPMRRSSPAVSNKQATYGAPVRIPEVEAFDPSRFEAIPIVAAYLSQENGSFTLPQVANNYSAFRKELIARIASSPRNLILMVVRGPSMQNTIEDGDMIMIDTGRKRIYEGCIYAIAIGQSVSLKRLYPWPDGRVMVASDNVNALSEMMSIQDLHIIGQVIWFSRELYK